MSVYREPVKIVIEKEIPLTIAALNKVLIVTDDKNADFKYYMNSKDVANDFGNNSKVYKLVENFLGQRDGFGNILKPDFFGIVGIQATGQEKIEDKLKEALNENLDQEWYGILTTFDSVETIKAVRPFLTENRKVYIAEVKAYPLADTLKSDRVLAIWNLKRDEQDREYRAAAYAGVVITKGAGYRVSMIRQTGVTADTERAKKPELAKNNITFLEKRTSGDRIIANGGLSTDGTYFDETTAVDCIIVNMNENLEILTIDGGIEQDERGYSKVEEKLHDVMQEMGEAGILARLNGKYDYKVYPVNQTKTEREQRLLRPRVLFRLKGWAYFIDLTLSITNKEINGGN